MTSAFKLVEMPEDEVGEKKSIYLGFDDGIKFKDTTGAVSGVCYNFSEFAGEIEKLQNQLEKILEEAKIYFGEPDRKQFEAISDDMTPEEAWAILSKIDGESQFFEAFNSLDDSRRRQVAEFVLTQCNVFSGRGALFSSCYDSDSGILE